MQTKDIKQEIVLPCSPQVAFAAWMDSKTHGAMIGGNAIINPKVGGKFDIWDGYAIGKTVELDPQRLKIVQEWRDDSTDWPDGHYSTIHLEFKPQGENETKLVFNHKGIPAKHAKSIEQGWIDYYWQPMKKYFAR
jgi:activator of HSP90 ATPase